MIKLKTYRFKLLLASLIIFVSFNQLAAQSPYYYQLKIYHFKTTSQEAAIDAYLKGAYSPALHRAGIKEIGVFKPIVADTADRLIYVFIPFKRLTDVDKLNEQLKNDKLYLSTATSYINADYKAAPYNRIESILLKAFSVMPVPAIPRLNSPKTERVYELRSYEAATEQLSLNKIGMFNDAEVAIFTKLNFNAVFYGQVIAGSKMPNLMYLTTFNNKADRDQHWKEFGPEYKKIKDLPQYQNNVSKNITLFLYPTDYSDY
ncbi:NIPSNAP family containing protein [Pedobacter polaris]|uniref:NIPSNAP family containing protein n=1 Tax=Pedobacter polaris TaxID=2571273 RepID=A0A4U1CWJ9_9SPHI|nr:NIPSNAP family protein [Pedobacter polaris]TKC10689.1 NIPSNAP family containing protein [Pedobacter polaris]